MELRCDFDKLGSRTWEALESKYLLLDCLLLEQFYVSFCASWLQCLFSATIYQAFLRRLQHRTKQASSKKEIPLLMHQKLDLSHRLQFLLL
jgi:hypothetical protein